MVLLRYQNFLEFILLMSRKKKNTVIIEEKAPFFDDLSPQAKQAIGAVILGILGIFFLFSLLGFAGPAGEFTEKSLTYLLGKGAWLAPFVCGFYIFALLRPRIDEKVSSAKVLGISLSFISLLALLELYNEGLGGKVGFILAFPFSWSVGKIVTGVILVGFVFIGIFLTFNTGLKLPRFRQNDDELEFTETEEIEFIDEREEKNSSKNPKSEAGVTETEEAEEKPKKAFQAIKEKVVEKIQATANKNDDEIVVKNFSGHYTPPPLSLLQKDKGKAQAGDVKANSLTIKRTLKEFGINVEMDAVESGPAITRYSLKPAQGVRINKIVSLSQELQLALKASTIRIEAPIPGKSLVGIEVPNAIRSTVGLASVLRYPEYTDSKKPLLVALGKDVTGNVHFSDIAKMPHGLIAGTTGSGKSVTIHNIIISLLFRNSPEQLRFILVDPKMVELTLYNGIPHLLYPVITESKKALKLLSWAVAEMDRRYDILRNFGIQGLESYHQKVYHPAKKAWEKEVAKKEKEQALQAKERELEGEDNEEDWIEEEIEPDLPEPLPYIVVVLDELNDLMQAYPRELEALIVRLAQKSRAVGIHLLLATQRPSVNVITGTIKANVPTRIALNVASQIDSRTIIDQMGAEKLLGQGDMLYISSSNPRPVRIQSAFISGDEIKAVVDYLKAQNIETLSDSIDIDEQKDGNINSFMNSIGNENDVDDDLFDDAKSIVIETGRASTSYLQRRLGIGYNRAAKLMDILEEQGIIGPANGSKPREVLIKKDGTGEDNEFEEEN